MKQLITNIILSYLRFFARGTLKNHKPTTIGITGSAGKSSARTILYSILKDHFTTKMISGNSETGIPLGILGLKNNSLGFETPLKSVFDWLRIFLLAPFQTNNLQGTQYLIVEMGIDDPYPPKNMEYLLTIIKPDIAIYLNAFAGAVHSMQFEKILPKDNTLTDEEKREIKTKAIAAEKAKIITQSDCKVGIYNGDNPYVVESLSLWDNYTNTKTLTFGHKQAKDIILKEHEISLKGTVFTYKIADVKEPLTITLSDYLLQKDYGETIAAIILAALQTGLTIEQIKHSLEKKFSLPKSRATLFDGIKNSLIIDSTYNASRAAVEGMLDLLTVLKKQTKRPIVFLFGDMRELGEEAKTEHEAVAEKLIGIVDYLYCVGPLTQKYVVSYLQWKMESFDSGTHQNGRTSAQDKKEMLHTKEIRWFTNSQFAGEFMKEHLPKNAIVLAKGSQNTIFLEEALKHILENKKDKEKLCRQEEYWMEKKETFFTMKG